LFDGWSADRPITVSCAGFDPNSFRCCDQSQYDIPFRSDYKLAGSYPIAWGAQVGVALQRYAGLPLAVNWAVPANLFPGGLLRLRIAVLRPSPKSEIRSHRSAIARPYSRATPTPKRVIPRQQSGAFL
jgi:hypothetical protein